MRMFCLALLLAQAAVAQPTTKGTYRFPMPNSNGLTGTFMELRGSQFHYGIDIRTYERTGLPVVAAADGYISRVLVSYSGYGKAIFIQHPDSNSTCYAHVERFMPAVEAEVRRIQATTQQFDLQIFPKAGRYPVRRGDTIAWSGNAGASQGPHLHYEVRNSKEEIMNPLAWHLADVRDELAPFLNQIALQPLHMDSRVMGKFEKYVLTPQQSEHTYYHNPIIEVQGAVGLEYVGYDRLFGSRNWNGIYRTQLFLDDSLIYESRMDRFAFDQTRYVMQYVDYTHYARTRTSLQRCYVEPGNAMPIYHNLRDGGRITLRDTATHHLRLVVADYHGNQALFLARLRRTTNPPVPTATAAAAPAYSLQRGVLVITAPKATGGDGSVQVQYADSSTRSYSPAYHIGNNSVVLVPCTSNPLPVQARAAHWPAALSFGYTHLVQSALPTSYSTNGFSINFPPDAVFAPMPIAISTRTLQHPAVLSPVISIGNYEQAVFRGYQIQYTLQPGTLKLHVKPQQVVLCAVYGGGKSFYRAGADTRVGNVYSTIVASFGEYCLVADLTGPTLQPLNFKNGATIRGTDKLRLTLTDDISGVNPFRIHLKLDDSWVIPEYYNYQNTVFCELPLDLAVGQHSLVVQAQDQAGNVTEQRYTFYKQ